MKKQMIFAAALAALLPYGARAAILAVDFGLSTTDGDPHPSSPTQAGFERFDFATGDAMAFISGSGPHTRTISGYTVTLASGSSVSGTDQFHIGNRINFTADGGYTERDLLMERVVAQGGSRADEFGIGNGLYLQIGGLEANTQYEIKVWGVDRVGLDNNALKPGYNRLYDATFETTGSTSLDLLGQYTILPGITSIADADIYSISALVTSDDDGYIIVKSVSNMDWNGIINGFVLSAIPEPGHSAFALFGGLMILGLRRRNA